jgi:hypothetical protein
MAYLIDNILVKLGKNYDMTIKGFFAEKGIIFSLESPKVIHQK